jgi:hypothetical protein
MPNQLATSTMLDESVIPIPAMHVHDPLTSPTHIQLVDREVE